MEYGYDIQVVVTPSTTVGAIGYYATFSIHQDGDLACSGTIAVGLATPADAERRAFAAARLWVANNGSF